MQIEHKIPISKGGTNEMSNLTVLCQKCNCEQKE
ncbi:HNH endonuclease [Staphylococcus aureus]